MSLASWINMRFLVGTILLCLLLLLEPTLSMAAKEEKCPPEEKKVLLKIKKAYKNASSILNRSWSPDTDCCDYWYGVTCDFTNNHVISIAFMEGGFPGRIPDAIGDLPYLTGIIFHNVTNFSGPIPYSITKLQNLISLDITSSNLTGTIPVFLSKLKNLTYLDLSSNNLEGPIPSSLSEIPGLGFIKLSGNRLTGTIPESFLKLRGNDLFLILSDNKLSGEIPPSFRDLNFGMIDLSRNKLRGDISMLFGPNKTAELMCFAKNKFEFNMSKLPQLHSMLFQFDISHNKIYGSLPTEMINNEWLSLNVSYNSLCGPIPQGGKLQTDFDYTSFFHNRCLCGAPLNVTCK